LQLSKLEKSAFTNMQLPSFDYFDVSTNQQLLEKHQHQHLFADHLLMV